MHIILDRDVKHVNTTLGWRNRFIGYWVIELLVIGLLVIGYWVIDYWSFYWLFGLLVIGLLIIGLLGLVTNFCLGSLM